MPRPRDLNEKYEVGKSGRKEMNKDYGSIASLINNEVSQQSFSNKEVLRCTLFIKVVEGLGTI